MLFARRSSPPPPATTPLGFFERLPENSRGFVKVFRQPFKVGEAPFERGVSANVGTSCWREPPDGIVPGD